MRSTPVHRKQECFFSHICDAGSNSIQLIFSALVADPAALFAMGPGQVFILRLQNQPGNLHRLIMLIHTQMCLEKQR